MGFLPVALVLLIVAAIVLRYWRYVLLLIAVAVIWATATGLDYIVRAMALH